MRLSALVIVIVGILFLSLTVTAAPAGSSASTGSSASSSASHGSSSASSGSSASVHSSSSPAFHAAGGGHSAGMGATSSSKGVPSFKVPSPDKKAANEKPTRGFWHPFRRPQPAKAEFHFPVRCVKEPCTVCPPGSRYGACLVANNFCPGGESWNGVGCSPQYLFHDCSSLARQLEAQRRQMRGRNDPGQSLIYQTLLSQYQQCMARYGLQPFGSFAFNERMADLMP